MNEDLEKRANSAMDDRKRKVYVGEGNIKDSEDKTVKNKKDGEESSKDKDSEDK
jgi:hypothetical protein